MSKPSNPVGAPCKLNAETKQRILTALQKGAAYEIAANYAGISYNTFRSWMMKGEEQEGQTDGDEFLEFFRDVKKVEAFAACKWLEKIDEAANAQWQAAAWKLERRYYKHYSNQAAVLDFNDRLTKMEQDSGKETKDEETAQGHA